MTPPSNAQLPGSITNPIVAGGFPGISVSGYFGGSGLGRLGSPDFLPKFQHTDQFEYIDTLSWLRGNHGFKFGADIIAPMKNEYFDVPATRGSYTFGGNFSGNALADYLLGYVSGFQLSNVYVVDQRHWATMFFVQDDWTASDRLTLNLGLRYDFITPALEAQNRQTNFDPATANLTFAGSGSLSERGLVQPDKNNFGPRIGAVYKLDDKTLIRGGWGIFYNLFDRVGSEDQLALNVPGLVNTSLSRTSGSPLFFFEQGLPTGLLNPPSLNPADGQLKPIRVRAVSNDAPKFMMNQASIGLQREFEGGIVATADFVYTHGTNLATLVNLNQPLPSSPGANDAKGAVPYPNFGFIEWRSQDGKSTYKGIDAGVEKRFARGYAFGVAYTLGDSKDNSSEQLTTQGSNAFPQNSRDFSAWYGPSDYDVRHRLSTNFVWNLPLGDNAFLKDWTASGVYSVRSGRAFTVNQSNNNVGNSMTGLPDLTGDPEGAKTVDQWFNPKAFTPVSSGVFGNEQRNRLRGPGFQSFDLTVQRIIRFGDRYGLTLRWDAFNLFNKANFGLPNRNISGGDVATITSLAGDARVMQLAVRFTF
ncbi:MAG TPA: TonB-dependent receptor [Vicinamibacterales bacterium]|nr:TonB-dependent receptor [Vicinamibacterales bacterium]